MRARLPNGHLSHVRRLNKHDRRRHHREEIRAGSWLKLAAHLESKGLKWKKTRWPGDACRRNERDGWKGAGREKGGWKPEPNRRSDLPLIRARQNGIAFLRRFAALAKGRKKIGARGKKSGYGRRQGGKIEQGEGGGGRGRARGEDRWKAAIGRWQKLYVAPGRQ